MGTKSMMQFITMTSETSLRLLLLLSFAAFAHAAQCAGCRQISQSKGELFWINCFQSVALHKRHTCTQSYCERIRAEDEASIAARFQEDMDWRAATGQDTRIAQQQRRDALAALPSVRSEFLRISNSVSWSNWTNVIPKVETNVTCNVGNTPRSPVMTA